MENKNLILFIFVISSILVFAQTPEEKISLHLNYWILVCYCLLMFIIAGLVALVLALSGVTLFTNENIYEREKAKKRAKYAIVALIFILISCPLVNFLIEGGDVKEFRCECPPTQQTTTTIILPTTPTEIKTTTTMTFSTTTTIITLRGKVVFDSSWFRFISVYPEEETGPGACDNSKYILNVARYLERNGNKRILIYTFGGPLSNPNNLKNFLQSNGYIVDVIERDQFITYDLLSDYGQVWFMNTEDGINRPSSVPTSQEVDSVVEYYNNGGNILLSGDDEPYVFSVNKISQKFGVYMMGILLTEPSPGLSACVYPSFISHQVTDGLNKLSSSTTDSILSTINPEVEIIATIVDKEGVERPYIMVLH